MTYTITIRTETGTREATMVEAFRFGCIGCCGLGPPYIVQRANYVCPLWDSDMSSVREAGTFPVCLEEYTGSNWCSLGEQEQEK